MNGKFLLYDRIFCFKFEIREEFIDKCIFYRLGVGGNLVAVHASRLSTSLHQHGKPGQYKDNAHYYAAKICPNPYKVFFSNRMLIFTCDRFNQLKICFFQNLMHRPLEFYYLWQYQVI